MNADAAEDASLLVTALELWANRLETGHLHLSAECAQTLKAAGLLRREVKTDSARQGKIARLRALAQRVQARPTDPRLNAEARRLARQALAHYADYLDGCGAWIPPTGPVRPPPLTPPGRALRDRLRRLAAGTAGAPAQRALPLAA